MQFNLLTNEELQHFKKEFLEEIKKILTSHDVMPRLIKSKDVCKILHLSPGKLQQLRDAGDIEFIEMGNKYLYDLRHIQSIIATRTRKRGAGCIVYSILAPTIYWLSYLDQCVA